MREQKDFEAPINPMRAMNNEWDKRVEQMPRLRFVGYAWDAALIGLFGLGAYSVLSDPYGFGLGGGLDGVFFTVGGIVTWGLLLLLFFRPVGRAAMLKMVAVGRFVWRALRFLSGGSR